MALITVADLRSVLGTGSLYADSDLQTVVDAADNLVEGIVDAASYTAAPAELHEAALAIAVDIWQSRTAPGGQAVAVDFTPSPYRMGRTLLQRVMGLLGPHLAVGSMIG